MPNFLKKSLLKNFRKGNAPNSSSYTEHFTGDWTFHYTEHFTGNTTKIFMSQLQHHLDNHNTQPGVSLQPKVSLSPWFCRGSAPRAPSPESKPGSVPAPPGGFHPPKAAPTFLFSRELFCLFPDFSGIEEVGGDLDVAGSHLMDALRDRHRGPAPWRVGCPGRVISWIPWRQLWRDWRWHPNRFAAHPEGKMERQKCTSFRHTMLWDVS